MTLIIALPLWAPVALFGTGVLVSLAHQLYCKMRS